MRSIYKIVTKEFEIDQLIKYCKQTGYCSFDFETTSTEFYLPSEFLVSISISFQPGSAWFIPLNHPESPFVEKVNKIMKKLGKELFQDKDIVKVGWNLKFEYKWLFNYGIKFRGRVFDAMLLKHLLDEEKPNDLKSMVTKYLPEYAGYESTTKNQKMFNLPLDTLARYNTLDSDLTLRLFIWFEGKALNLTRIYKLYRNLVCMALRVITNSEWHGTLIDTELLAQLLIKYRDLITETEKNLRKHKALMRFEKWLIQDRKEKLIEKLEQEYEDTQDKNKEERIKAKIAKIRAGEYTNKKELAILEPVNFSSPKQMVDFFFTSPQGLELEPIAYSDGGQPSTDEATLIALAKQEEDGGFIANLLKFRELEKLNSTYVEGINNRLYNGKIYPGYLIHGTVTGRFCISDKGILETNHGNISIREFCPSEEGSVAIIKDTKVLTHTGEYQYIVGGHNKGVEEMYEVCLEDGKKIECTLNHIFLTNHGWVPLQEIMNNTNFYKIITKG